MGKIAGFILAAVLGFIILLGAFGAAFYFVVLEHPAVQTGREFLKNNQRLKDEIGEVKELSVSPKKLGYTWAIVQFKATSEKISVKGSVSLSYRDKWEITGAHFYDEARHRSIDLLK